MASVLPFDGHFADYVTKPLAVVRLLEAVDRLLGKRCRKSNSADLRA
jgi:hypothetical protein